MGTIQRLWRIRIRAPWFNRFVGGRNKARRDHRLVCGFARPGLDLNGRRGHLVAHFDYECPFPHEYLRACLLSGWEQARGGNRSLRHLHKANHPRAGFEHHASREPRGSVMDRALGEFRAATELGFGRDQLDRCDNRADP